MKALPSNITKSLSLNSYRLHSTTDKDQYLSEIDKEYNGKRLEELIEKISSLIDSDILYTVHHNFSPYGASAAALIAESHIAIHTYPDYHPTEPMGVFRIDIDISGCGKISPLRSLDYLLTTLDSHLMVIDYKERGFSYENGEKVFGNRMANVNENVSNLKDYYIHHKDGAHILKRAVIHDPLIEKEVTEIMVG